MFDELIGKVKELESRLDSGSTQHWATVTQASPLRVRFDGDAAALLVTPINLVGTLTVGDRVRAELNNGQLYITDKLNGLDLTGKTDKMVELDSIATRIDSGSYQSPTGTTAEGWPLNDGAWQMVHATTHNNTANYFSMQFGAGFFDGSNLYYRNTCNNGAAPWKAIAFRDDLAAYAPASHNHTVSQVSDFATVVGGAVTSNNYYEKYADGQLICRGVTIFATGSQSYTWTFPVSFVGQLPQIVHSHNTTVPEALHASHSSLALSSVIIQHNRSTAGSTTLYYSAQGRWK